MHIKYYRCIYSRIISSPVYSDNNNILRTYEGFLVELSAIVLQNMFEERVKYYTVYMIFSMFVLILLMFLNACTYV